MDSSERLNQINAKPEVQVLRLHFGFAFLLFLMLRPIKRPSNRLIPAGEQLAAFILVHRGRIQRIAPLCHTPVASPAR